MHLQEPPEQSECPLEASILLEDSKLGSTNRATNKRKNDSTSLFLNQLNEGSGKEASKLSLTIGTLKSKLKSGLTKRAKNKR